MIAKVPSIACITSVWAGVDIAWEQEKPEVRKMLKRPPSPKAAVPQVHALMESFWANEAIFQLMMLAYNLLLLVKMDFAGGTSDRRYPGS